MTTALGERLLATALDESREVKEARRLMMEVASRRRETIFGLHLAGVSLRGIAAKIGCSPSVVQNAIRHARASRPQIELSEDRIAYELHRALAEKLDQDPGPIIEHGRSRVDRMLQETPNPLPRGCHEQWSRLLAGGVDDLKLAMVAAGSDADALRRCSPLIGSLSKDERELATLKAEATAL